MIVDFHRTGAGKGECPIEYLLGKDFKREGARLLRGSARDTIDLINSINFAQRYCSGVLSFAKGDNLSEKQKSDLMDSFEQMLLPGLDADQYSCLWVEHWDKGRLELNFVFPCIELISGNKLQPYYAPADKRRVNAWGIVKRAELGLTDPNEPKRKQILNITKNLPKERKEIPKYITDYLLHLIEAGQIKDRRDVINKLEEQGLKVVRQTKSAISIADADGGQNIRLKGWIYEQDVRFDENSREESERRDEDYRSSSAERLQHFREELTRAIEIKRSYIISRYQRERANLKRKGQTEYSSYVEDNKKQMVSSGIIRNNVNPINSRDNVVFNSKVSYVSRQDNATNAKNIRTKSGNNRGLYEDKGTGRQDKSIESNRYVRGSIRNVSLFGSEIRTFQKLDSGTRGTQREKSIQFYNRRIKRKKLNERDRTTFIEEFARDREQTATAINDIFRGFKTRLIQWFEEVNDWFTKFRQNIANRRSGESGFSKASKQLEYTNGRFSEQIKFFNSSSRSFSTSINANAAINTELNQANRTIKELKSSITTAIQVNLRLIEERKEAEKEELRQRYLFINKVINRLKNEAKNYTYIAKKDVIEGDKKHIDAIHQNLVGFICDFKINENLFIKSIFEDFDKAKKLKKYLDIKDENYQNLIKKINQKRGRSR